MAVIPKLVSKATKKSGNAVTRSTIKNMGMVEEVAPLRLGGPKAGRKTSAAALMTTGAVGAAAMADGMPKKGAPTAVAKGRRGGVAPSATAKAEASSAKAAGAGAAANDGNKKAPAPTTAKKTLGGREVKNGKVFVSAEELKKSGLSLRDFLNKERGLTRRADKPKAALKPIQSQTEFRAEQDKMAARKKAIADKAKRETTKGKK